MKKGSLQSAKWLPAVTINLILMKIGETIKPMAKKKKTLNAVNMTRCKFSIDKCE